MSQYPPQDPQGTMSDWNQTAAAEQGGATTAVRSIATCLNPKCQCPARSSLFVCCVC